MMKLKVIIILIFLINLATGARAEDKYTLEYCLKKALEANQDIKAAGYDMASAQSKISSARADFLPTLGFSGNYSRLSAITPFAITLPPGKTLNVFPSIVNNYGLNLALTQPIFTGSKLRSNYEIAQNTSLAKESSLEEVRNNIKYTIEQYFWMLVYAIESERVINESYELTKDHLTDTKNLQQAGMASENDVKKVEVQLSNMELMKTTLEKNIELNKSVLCKTMNISLDTQFEPDYSLSVPVFNLNQEEITAQALQKRPLLISMEFGLKSAEAAKKIVKSNYYPSIFLVSNYVYARPNTRVLPLKDRWANTWNAGINIQFTLWNWGKTRTDYQSAQNDYLKAQTQYENLQRQTELDVKRIFLDIQESIKKYQVSLKMVDQAEENYRISKDKYKNGMLLSSELLDAEVDLVKSKLEVTNSIMEFNVRKAELKKTAGMEE